jgi:hypothetical protein
VSATAGNGCGGVIVGETMVPIGLSSL